MANLPPTKRLYYADSFLTTGEGTILAVFTNDNQQLTVVLDQTIMHPQGGGQPSDKGELRCGDATLAVDQVSTDAATKKIVLHTGRLVSGALENLVVGSKCQVVVDEDARLLHARLHSAGHLLDGAMQQVGRSDLVPTKGYHFPDGGAYVEYDGEVEADARASLAEALGRKCQELIDADLPVNVDIAEDADGGILRTVSMGGVSCPCGGTHVTKTGQIKGIVVSKIKKNKKSIRVSYDIVG